MTEALTVHQAIAAVIADLPAIGKDSKITEGPQKYSYRGIEAIKAELKPLLGKHGVHYAPVDIGPIDDSTYNTRNGAEWQRVRMVVRYRIYGPDGSHIEAVGRGEGADNSDKACNKAMTVAEKQMLVQTFCIADGDKDPDHQRAEEQATRYATVAEAKRRIMDGVGKDEAALWWKDAEPGDGPFAPDELERMIATARQWVESS